jgi:hypothetical protein
MNQIIYIIIYFLLSLTIFSLYGIITKILFGVDVNKFLSRLPIFIFWILVSIWVFTTQNDMQHIAENITTLVFLMIYFIFYLLFPFIIGELISDFLYNLFGFRYQ